MQIKKEQSLLALERAKSQKRTEDLEADLKLLNIKKEVAVAEAEVPSAEGEEICDRNIGTIEIESQTERTKKYVEQHSSASLYSDRKLAVNYERPSSVIRQSISQRPVPDASSIQTRQLTVIPADFTRYMLKKDLLVSRLIKFNNKPEFYPSWRDSFKSVMLELDAKPEEEIYFLIKYTSNSSQQQIISIKSANSHNPRRGLQRIWQRLEERFGSPELIETSLKTKLNSFPPITNKELHRLYDLSDVLEEI